MTTNPLSINERAQSLLKTLIECYLRDGQPVGSRTLARDSELHLSPATVRNVMIDLEEMGLVSSPHTSAGRIPTAQGYRVFVDSLLRLQSLDSEEVRRLKQQLDPGNSVPDLLKRASRLLSGVTRMAGVVTVPRRERVILRHIEFLDLASGRVLAILVSNEGEVHNHVIHTSRRYTRSELEQAGNYLNARLGGKDLAEMRAHLLDAMRETKEEINALMQATLEAAEHLANSGQQDADYVLDGQTNLMEFAELANIDNLRKLFETFNEKRDILHLLDQCLKTGGVQIFIGEESGYRVLGDCTVITSPYKKDGEVLGVLGIIGPTRMAYERVIPIVDVTAKLLGAALNSRY